MKKTVLAIAFAVATMPLTFAQSAPKANPPASSSTPAPQATANSKTGSNTAATSKTSKSNKSSKNNKTNKSTKGTKHSSQKPAVKSPTSPAAPSGASK